MKPNPDNYPDKMSGLGWLKLKKVAIPTDNRG